VSFVPPLDCLNTPRIDPSARSAIVALLACQAKRFAAAVPVYHSCRMIRPAAKVIRSFHALAGPYFGVDFLSLFSDASLSFALESHRFRLNTSSL